MEAKFYVITPRGQRIYEVLAFDRQGGQLLGSGLFWSYVEARAWRYDSALDAEPETMDDYTARILAADIGGEG